MADFTTWSALLTQIRNDLANRDLTFKSYRSPDGTFVEYRSFTELKEIEAFVADKAANESATSGQPTRRVHTAIQGGSW